MTTHGYTPRGRRSNMKSRNRKMARVALYILGAALFALAVGMITGWYLDLPDVHYDGGTKEAVACKAVGTEWREAPMSHPACQEAPKGRHHAEWAAPRGVR